MLMEMFPPLNSDHFNSSADSTVSKIQQNKKLNYSNNITYQVANRRKYNNSFNTTHSKKAPIENAELTIPSSTPTKTPVSTVTSTKVPVTVSAASKVASTNANIVEFPSELSSTVAPLSPSYSLDYLHYVGSQMSAGGQIMAGSISNRNGTNTNNNNNSKNQNYFSINDQRAAAAAAAVSTHETNKICLVSPNNCISPSAAPLNYYNTHQSYFHPAHHYHAPPPAMHHHQQQQQQQSSQQQHIQLSNYHINNNYTLNNRNVSNYHKRNWNHNYQKKRQNYPCKSTTELEVQLQNGHGALHSTSAGTLNVATPITSSTVSIGSQLLGFSKTENGRKNLIESNGSQLNTTDSSSPSLTPPRDTKSESPPTLLTVPVGGRSTQSNGSPKYPNNSMTQSMPSIDTLSSPHRRLEYDSDSSHSSYHRNNEFTSFRSSHSPHQFHMVTPEIGGVAGTHLNDCGTAIAASDDLYFRGHQVGYYGSHQNLTMWNPAPIPANGAFGSHGYYSTSSLVTSSSVNQSSQFGHDGVTQQKRSSSERNSPQGNASSRGGASANNRRQQNNYHNHRQLGQIDGNSALFTPPDRFLARSHLVEVKTAPSTLLNGSKWDPLSQMVWDQFFVNQQTEETYKKKMYLWRYLYLCVRRTYPRFGLYLVGSTISGFGSDSSDVDMCLVSRTVTDLDPRHEAMMHLTHLQDQLVNTSSIFDTFNLIQAKVPILRFKDSLHKLEVDLNFNNSVGIRNTHLVYCYSQMDWRLRPLALVVKLWAQFHNINNAKDMTISSYSLVLMTIHFLQCAVSPPVLPCLHTMYPHKFQKMPDTNVIDMHEDLNAHYSGNDQTLGELFLLFLEYYSNFDYANYAISIRTATLLPIEECRLARSLKNDPHQWKELCIEEPFDLTNTARSVYDCVIFEQIKSVFVKSYQTLNESMDLGSIFTTPFLLPSTCSTDELS